MSNFLNIIFNTFFVLAFHLILISSFNELLILTFYFFETNSLLSLRTNKYSVTINLGKLDFSFTDIPIYVMMVYIHEEFENAEMGSTWLYGQQHREWNLWTKFKLVGVVWTQSLGKGTKSFLSVAMGKIARQLEPFTSVKTTHIGCLITDQKSFFVACTMLQVVAFQISGNQFYKDR